MVIGKEAHNQQPFGILEIGRGGLLEFGHSPSLPDYLRNPLLGGPLICFLFSGDVSCKIENISSDYLPLLSLSS
jgi:hypothetical protein